MRDNPESLARIMVEIDRALDTRSRVGFISACHRRRRILAWCREQADAADWRMAKVIR